jgi:hypothetical protein
MLGELVDLLGGHGGKSGQLSATSRQLDEKTMVEALRLEAER